MGTRYKDQHCDLVVDGILRATRSSTASSSTYANSFRKALSQAGDGDPPAKKPISKYYQMIVQARDTSKGQLRAVEAGYRLTIS